MVKIICRNCGATGQSKCPYCRSIFNDNKVESMLSHSLGFDFIPPQENELDNNPIYLLKIRLELSPDKELNECSLSAAQMADTLRKWLNLMTEGKEGFPSLEQYFCHHKWEFAPGQKSLIDCGH